MRRRELIGLVCGAAIWPLATRAQQPTMPVIGFLSSGSPEILAHLIDAFRQGLQEAGYVEGRNVVFEYRTAGAMYDQFPAMAADLVRRRVALIIAPNPAAALAAEAATSTIPIVFQVSGDAVQLGLFKSFNRPGGNATGVILDEETLASKRLELLHEIVPAASLIGLLVNPNSPEIKDHEAIVSAAAREMQVQVLVLAARNEREFDQAFATLRERNAGVLLVDSDAFFSSQRQRLVELAAGIAIPTIYDRRDYTAAGGLISYGPERLDRYRQMGIYAGRILKGERPANMPVMQATRYELAINLATAKALGLTIPPRILAIADELIE